MFRSSRWAALLLSVVAFSGPATAQAVKRDPAVEAILSEALVERGAFAACARIAPNKAQPVEQVATSWQLDLNDTAKLLRRSGYDAGYVEALVVRSDLDTATPRFSAPAQLAAYCGTLGDWQERLADFKNIVPQESIDRLLKRRLQ